MWLRESRDVLIVLGERDLLVQHLTWLREARGVSIVLGERNSLV